MQTTILNTSVACFAVSAPEANASASLQERAAQWDP